MFEAKLAQSSLLKKVLDALKEIVEDTNLECSSSGQSRLLLPHLLLSLSLSLSVCVCVCVQV